jgi:hypothetical protein
VKPDETHLFDRGRRRHGSILSGKWAAREYPGGPEDVPNPQRLLTSSWRPSSFQPSSSPAS